MLYQAYELSHAAMAPMRRLASISSQLYQTPLNPWSHTLLGKNISAACQLFESVTRRYPKPAWRLNSTSVNAFPVPIKERIILQKPFANLLHFERDADALAKAKTEDSADPRVLIVAPMSGHYATLLRQTVEAFLPEHEVYITDWKDAREVPLTAGKFDLNDYIDYIIEMLQTLGPGVNVIAICQPGPPVLAAISVLSEENVGYLPATMTYMGSPIDTRLSPTVPNNIAKEHSYQWFKKHMIHTVPWPNKGRKRRVYPGFLQLTGFISMNKDRHLSAHRKFFDHLVEGDCDSAERHKEFYDEYLAVLDMTEEFYLQTIRDVFQEHKLAKGTFKHRGRLVNPAAITQVALMTVEGEKDDISGIGQTQAAHSLCNHLPDSLKMDYIQPGVGHYGIFSGKSFRDTIQPKLSEFIKCHFDNKKEQIHQQQKPELVRSQQAQT